MTEGAMSDIVIKADEQIYTGVYGSMRHERCAAIEVNADLSGTLVIMQKDEGAPPDAIQLTRKQATEMHRIIGEWLAES